MIDSPSNLGSRQSAFPCGPAADRPPPTLAVVVPCYNEERALSHTHAQLSEVLRKLNESGGCSRHSLILYVDDGSRDDTWGRIAALAAQDGSDAIPQVAGLRLARNAGHQAALIAGLNAVSGLCDAVVSIDADLQDDPAAIAEMVVAYRSGAEVVLGVRRRRDTDTAFKRMSARAYYRVLRALGVDLVSDHADYRLLSRSALNSLLRFEERALFLRALPGLLSSRIEHVYYDRAERVAGESKYSLSKMISLGWRGVTANSIAPLRGVLIAGLATCAGSLCALGYSVVSWSMTGVIPGWTSIAAPLYLLGGMIMLSIGLLGEYLGRIYIEVKKRPLYLIDTSIGIPSEPSTPT